MSLPMTRERYDYLMRDTKSELTDAEVNAGWHFCYDFDGLLVNHLDGGPEAACCTCFK